MEEKQIKEFLMLIENVLYVNNTTNIAKTMIHNFAANKCYFLMKSNLFHISSPIPHSNRAYF